MQTHASTLEGTRCARHLDRAATVTCARCGDYACSACSGPTLGGELYCNDCLDASALVPASRSSRLAAQLINGVATLVPAAPVFLIGVLDEELATFLLSGVALGFLALACIQVYLLGTRGQSLGKLAMGIRIVSKDGTPAGLFALVFLRIIVPQFIAAFCGLFSLIDALSIFSADSRCIHDVIASTIVVRDTQVPRSF